MNVKTKKPDQSRKEPTPISAVEDRNSLEVKGSRRESPFQKDPKEVDW